LALVDLTQRQCTQSGVNLLKTAAQQLLHLLPISFLEFNVKPYAPSHTSDAQPAEALHNYQA